MPELISILLAVNEKLANAARNTVCKEVYSYLIYNTVKVIVCTVGTAANSVILACTERFNKKIVK